MTTRARGPQAAQAGATPLGRLARLAAARFEAAALVAGGASGVWPPGPESDRLLVAALWLARTGGTGPMTARITAAPPGSALADRAPRFAALGDGRGAVCVAAATAPDGRLDPATREALEDFAALAGALVPTAIRGGRSSQPPAPISRLELDLRSAVARGEFGLVYQPVVRLPAREVVAYEALLRWHHPRRGRILPQGFIPLAEASGLIVAIGDWVQHRACSDAAHWPENLGLQVNVSPVQLAEPGFADRLEAALVQSGLAPARLVLEVTETALLDTRLDLAAIFAGLRAQGLRLALDDFGTGYTAWSRLLGHVFDLVKIDGSFTARIDEPETLAILTTLMELADRLGIDTVVEGVETEAQLARLQAEGCTLVQGHLTGTALAAGAIGSA